MVKRRAGKDAKDDSSPVKSDEDAIRERSVRDGFKNADLFTQVLGWALWGVGAAWFLLYTSEAPSMGTWHIVCEPSMSMLLAGMFSGNLAVIKPQGAWSWWRKPWHLAWGVAWLLMAICFSRLGGHDTVTYPYHVALATLALAVGHFFTLPGGSAPAGKMSDAYAARMLLVVDGGLGLFLCAGILVGMMGNDMTPKAALLANAGSIASLSSLGLWSVGTALSQTDAELLSAAPPALLAHLAGAGIYFYEGSILAYASVALALLHVALYLPFPADNVDTNPFYCSVRSKVRGFQKLLANPIDGWGEDDG